MFRVMARDAVASALSCCAGQTIAVNSCGRQLTLAKQSLALEPAMIVRIR